MSGELLRLCREVFKRKPEWGIEHHMLHFDKDDLILMRNYNKGIGYRPEDGDTPLYTSDYILERLPQCLESRENGDNWLTVWVDGNNPDDRESDIWWAEYGPQDDLDRELYPSAVGGTPLEALLKLVIVLHDAGEL